MRFEYLLQNINYTWILFKIYLIVATLIELLRYFLISPDYDIAKFIKIYALQPKQKRNKLH